MPRCALQAGVSATRAKDEGSPRGSRLDGCLARPDGQVAQDDDGELRQGLAPGDLRANSHTRTGPRAAVLRMTEPQVRFRIWRQQSPDHEGAFEEFKLPFHKGANVISCLMEIQRHPVNAEGAPTTPVVWDSSCLEEVCGSCTMNINGRVRMACSTLIEKLQEPITLEPLRKFPLVRDLAVDRHRMFEA